MLSVLVAVKNEFWIGKTKQKRIVISVLFVVKKSGARNTHTSNMVEADTLDWTAVATKELSLCVNEGDGHGCFLKKRSFASDRKPNLILKPGFLP